MVTRIERPRSRLRVFLLGVAFLLIFVILLGIGAGAPNVLLVATAQDENTGSLAYNRKTGVNTYLASFELSRENQLFWMDLRLGNDDDLVDQSVDINGTLTVKTHHLDDNGLADVVSYNVASTQLCLEGEEWCDYFFLWKRDFVDHDRYAVMFEFDDPSEYLTDGVHHGRKALFDVDSKVTSINPEFTRFEIGWKYFWLIMTVLVMFSPCGVGYMSALRRRRRDTEEGTSYHQKWTAVLLWSLVWFNDPFVALTVYTNWSKVWSAVFILCASLFVFLILLFWLCLLSDLRFMQQHDGDQGGRGVCYWIPKVILTGAIGVTVFAGYMYYRFEDSISFEYTGVADEKKAAEELAGLLGFMLAVYMLWAIVLVLRSCGGLRRVSPSYVLLFSVTLLACLVAIIGVFVAAYYPYSTSGVAFVGIHGLLNLYVWTLAVSFAPVRPGSSSSSREMMDKPADLPAVVVGTDRDLSGWPDKMDSDFKAVEL